MRNEIELQEVLTYLDELENKHITELRTIFAETWYPHAERPNLTAAARTKSIQEALIEINNIQDTLRWVLGSNECPAYIKVMDK